MRPSDQTIEPIYFWYNSTLKAKSVLEKSRKDSSICCSSSQSTNPRRSFRKVFIYSARGLIMKFNVSVLQISSLNLGRRIYSCWEIILNLHWPGCTSFAVLKYEDHWWISALILKSLSGGFPLQQPHDQHAQDQCGRHRLQRVFGCDSQVSTINITTLLTVR